MKYPIYLSKFLSIATIGIIMQGINKVFLLGNLGADPEAFSFKDGNMITKFSLATSERWIDKISGSPQERTEWHKIVLHGFLADLGFEKLHKGSKVYVEGSKKTRKWTDNNGINQYATEIHAERLELLDPEFLINNTATMNEPKSPQLNQTNVANDPFSIENDIPFT